MKRTFHTIVVTGGSGFIGSNFIRFLLESISFDGKIVNIDKLTYAGNQENLSDIVDREAGKQYFFEKADICDRSSIEAVFEKYQPDALVHFAAESHVDRSINGPEEFIRTNVMGTFTLLDVARKAWKGREDVLFHHISTDEVFGSLGSDGYFSETTPYEPRSPYSASKAASDHLVRAYFHTYGLPVTISNCSNNFGPCQFPEKLIPLMILNIRDGKSLPVYGDGKNIRDWVYVEDHNEAVWLIMNEGRTGDSYNIGGDSERENIWIVQTLCDIVSRELGLDASETRKLITSVIDRPGHDRRYAIDCSKIKTELGWKRKMSFEEGLASTVRWYLSHENWINHVTTGTYREWIRLNYLPKAMNA